jgi:hypothetical protein
VLRDWLVGRPIKFSSEAVAPALALIGCRQKGKKGQQSSVLLLIEWRQNCMPDDAQVIMITVASKGRR